MPPVSVAEKEKTLTNDCVTASGVPDKLNTGLVKSTVQLELATVETLPAVSKAFKENV